MPLATLGFAIFLLIGGIGVTLHGVSWVAMLGLLVLGAAAGGWALKQKWSQTLKPSQTTLPYLLIGVFLLFAVGYITHLTYKPWFNPHDDYHAYLVHPIRLLQQGWFGEDPFNFRMLTSGLGGHPFFLAYALVLSDENIFYVFEFFIGFACFVEVVAWHARKRPMPPALLMAGLCSFFVTLQHTVNASSTFTSIPLFYWLLALAYERQQSKPTIPNHHWPVMVGAAALLVLKTSNLAPALLCVGLYSWHAPKKLENKCLELGSMLLGVLVLIGCWGFAHQESTGSFLYPLLGKGASCFSTPAFLMAQSEQLGTALQAIASGLLNNPVFMLLGILLGIHFAVPGQNRTWTLWLILCSTLWGFIVLGKMGPHQLDESASYLRYAAPFWQAMIAFCILRLQWPQKIPRSLWLLILLLLLGTPVERNLNWLQQVNTRAHQLMNIRSKHADVSSPQALRAEIQKAQNSIPEGAPLFVRASRPANLDFARNPIFVSDWPNSAGPDQCSLLQSNDASGLQSYFLGQDIHFILYAYRDQAGYSRGMNEFRIRGPNPIWKTIAQRTLDFQDRLLDAKKQFKVIYDDGYHVVLDLTQRSQQP
tara:strand:+ start:728 stop:2503 length:1776 start_codon:yes stop_codon:yes gene_type:complete